MWESIWHRWSKLVVYMIFYWVIILSVSSVKVLCLVTLWAKMRSVINEAKWEVQLIIITKFSLVKYAYVKSYLSTIFQWMCQKGSVSHLINISQFIMENNLICNFYIRQEWIFVLTGPSRFSILVLFLLGSLIWFTQINGMKTSLM